jgi:hypothetical protein
MVSWCALSGGSGLGAYCTVCRSAGNLGGDATDRLSDAVGSSRNTARHLRELLVMFGNGWITATGQRWKLVVLYVLMFGRKL